MGGYISTTSPINSELKKDMMKGKLITSQSRAD